MTVSTQTERKEEALSPSEKTKLNEIIASCERWNRRNDPGLSEPGALDAAIDYLYTRLTRSEASTPNHIICTGVPPSP